jgi:flagellar protein FlgJ
MFPPSFAVHLGQTRGMNPMAPIPSVFDAQALAALKGGLRKEDAQALKAAAQQFEALFLQIVLKSMRATAPQEGPLDSDQTRFYQELLDAQLAQVLAAQGGAGLAKVIERQLARSAAAEGETQDFPLDPPPKSYPFERPRAWPLPATSDQTAPLRLEGAPLRPAAAAAANRAATPAPTLSFASEFINDIWPHAVAASQVTGIPARFIVAHAALESGWGRFEPRFPDGRPSHNLFGIKAGSGWSGAVVEATTSEFVAGQAVRRTERFRAYASYADAFADYARLIAQRYAGVLGSIDPRRFAQGLQQAGYASDPDYAAKLERVIAQFG